jgi:hypothetical protein
MDRRTALSYRLLVFVGLMIILVGLGGCTQGLFTLAYFIKGLDEDAECNALCGKRVVVVCRPIAALKYANARVDQELAEGISDLLKANVKKIKMVDHAKVAEWMDEHPWEEYAEVGKAMDADIVVGVDLEQFDLLQGQTLYQGRASTEIKVYDCKTGAVIFKKNPPQTAYPPNALIQTSEMREDQFRRVFIRVLSDRIGRYFYSHDAYADVGLDSRSMD